MRVVFLDIDGVIATSQTYNRWFKHIWERMYPGISWPHSGRERQNFKKSVIATTVGDALLFDPDCCRRVDELCALSGAVIYISSSWRHDHRFENLVSMLRLGGIKTAPILGITPLLGTHRGHQIGVIVHELGLRAEDIVILEDVEDVSPYKNRQVKTTFEGSHPGFQDKHLKLALHLFGIE